MPYCGKPSGTAASSGEVCLASVPDRDGREFDERVVVLVKNESSLTSLKQQPSAGTDKRTCVSTLNSPPETKYKLAVGGRTHVQAVSRELPLKASENDGKEAPTASSRIGGFADVARSPG